MKTLNIDNCVAALEKMDLSERTKDLKFTHKALLRFAGFFATLGRNTYDESDINMRTVEKLLEHKEHLKDISNWIFDTDYGLLDKLRVVKRDLDPIIKPPSEPRLYRGFAAESGQQTMGIEIKSRWFRKPLVKAKVGDKFSFTPDKLMSLTTNELTARDYGGIVVSCSMADVRKRCLHITPEVIWAARALDFPDPEKKPPLNFVMSYDESLFIPDGEPIEFTIEQIKV